MTHKCDRPRQARRKRLFFRRRQRGVGHDVIDTKSFLANLAALRLRPTRSQLMRLGIEQPRIRAAGRGQ